MGFQFPCYSLTPSWHHVARHIKLQMYHFLLWEVITKKKKKKQGKQ